ncbi:response regulator [Thermomonospora catenispora]|uniref:response regulator n=1 Tax=Thermomonospora catenispora TaxID=2493090 RepID=UPI001F4F90A9|nr:response regulator transcription factor [Thermomonospora catenispora]
MTPSEPPGGPDRTIRVLVVDDQTIVRAGFAALLNAQPGITVVGEAGDGREAVALAAQTRPDVVVMDIRMPGMDGIEATRRMLDRPDADLKVLVLTTFDVDEYVYDALRAGASGFLLKDATADELVSAVRVVARGDALLAPQVTGRLIREFTRQRRTRPQPPAELATLTARETEVLVLIAGGLSNAEIARRLVLSEHTVKTHVARVFTKLGLRDRAQAVVLAYESGLVVPGEGAQTP